MTLRKDLSWDTVLENTGNQTWAEYKLMRWKECDEYVVHGSGQREYFWSCTYCSSKAIVTMVYRDPDWDLYKRFLCEHHGNERHGFMRWEFMKARLRTTTPNKDGARVYEYDSPYPRNPTWSSE